MRSKGEREREGGREDKSIRSTHGYTWCTVSIDQGQSTAHYSDILVGEL